MHEAHLIDAVIEKVQQVAEEHGASRVLSVDIKLGELSEFSPESLEMYFRFKSKGTMAESAALNIKVEQAQARCAACGAQFKPEDTVCACPQCGDLRVEILSGQGIALTSVELDQ